MNSVQLLGRLARDPEVRYTAGDNPTAVARFTVACNRKYKKDAEQEADFISCLAFGKTAEFIERYFSKGSSIALNGRIQTGSYTNKDGNKVYTTDVVIEGQEFAESKKSSDTQDAKAQEEAQNTEEGFMSIPEGAKDDLPFKNH